MSNSNDFETEIPPKEDDSIRSASGLANESQKEANAEDALSISSDDIDADDCSIEALDVSSDEEFSQDPDFDGNDIEEEEDVKWTIDMLSPDPVKLQGLRRPWNVADPKLEFADSKSLELFKGAMDDLANGTEFTLEDWDATLNELLSKSMPLLLNRYIRDEDSTDLPATICKWVKYGLEMPLMDSVHHDVDGRDQSGTIRHLKIGFNLLQSIIVYHDPRFFAALLKDSENSSNIISKLVNIACTNPITKIRYLAVENLFQCLSQAEDPFTAADILRTGTNEDGLSHIESLFISISDATDVEETTEFVRMIHLIMERAFLSTCVRELREITKETFRSCELLPTVYAIFKEVETRFWRVDRLSKELQQNDCQIFGILEKGLIVEASCLLLAHGHQIDGVIDAVILFYEKMFSVQLNFSLLSFAFGSPKALNFLMKLLLVHEKAHEEPNDLNCFDESPKESTYSRIHKLRETIGYGLRTLELLNQVQENFHTRNFEVTQLESPSLMDPLQELLEMISRGGQAGEVFTVLGATHFPIFYDICKIAKTEKVTKRRKELLSSNYAEYCFQLMHHILRNSDDFYLWLNYADKLKNLQSYGIISRSFLDWISYVADPVIRSARDGSKSSVQRFKQRLSAASSKSDSPNAEVVMLLRLMEIVITREDISSKAAREQTIANLSTMVLPDIEKIFRRSTSFHHSLWRLGTPISSEESFNYRSVASSCMRILSVIYGEMVKLTGTNEGLNPYTDELERVIEVLSMTSGINGQRPSEESFNLRRDALNLLDSIMQTHNECDWIRFHSSLLNITRPSLYPSVLSLLWSLAGNEKCKVWLKCCKDWAGLTKMVLAPSDYVLQLSIPTVKRLCALSGNIAESIAGSFIDHLRCMVINRSIIKKTDVTDISDDEDSVENKEDSSNYTDAPVAHASPLLLRVVEIINMFVTSSETYKNALAKTIGSSNDRSNTWQVLIDLSWKSLPKDEVHCEFSTLVQTIALSVCSIGMYSERLSDLVIAQLRAERVRERELKKCQTIEPVGADCVDLDVFDVDIECEGESDIPSVCRIESCLSRTVSSLVKWEDHSLADIGERLNTLKKIACCGNVQAKEVSRALSATLPALLLRFDSGFSVEDECINAISEMLELLDTIEKHDSKISTSVVHPCISALTQLCELLTGNEEGNERIAERVKAITRWDNREMDSEFGKYTSHVDSDIDVDKEFIDDQDRLLVIWRPSTNKRIPDELFDEKLFKQCSTMARNGESFRRNLKEVEIFVRNGGSHRKQAHIQPAETKRQGPPRKKFRH